VVLAYALAFALCFALSFTAAMVWGYFLETLDSGDDV
jgi:hypothetical protein